VREVDRLAGARDVAGDALAELEPDLAQLGEVRGLAEPPA
jgi:hypothetical protein